MHLFPQYTKSQYMPDYTTHSPKGVTIKEKMGDFVMLIAYKKSQHACMYIVLLIYHDKTESSLSTLICCRLEMVMLFLTSNTTHLTCTHAQ